MSDTSSLSSRAVYIGTYTRKSASKGIYRLSLDAARGALTAPELAAEATNPTFLVLDPSRRFLYAVSEIGAPAPGKPGGAVSAFAVEKQSGKLTPLNQQPSGGAGPCHVILDRGAKNLLVANYSSGSAAVLPIGADGRLTPPSCVVQHAGSGPDPNQKGPHAHSVNLDAAGRFAFIADLGIDKLMVYRFDPAAGTLTANDPPAAGLAPGAGPRHFAFGPGQRFAYVINELNSTLTVFAYDSGRGSLAEVQTISTLPAGFTGENSTAHVAIHPNGRFLYGSNRGHDSIAIFAIDAATGKLTALGHQSTSGKTPRHFAIDPTGVWMLVANQDSDNLVLLALDPRTGGLSPTGVTVAVPAPVCVAIAE